MGKFGRLLGDIIGGGIGGFAGNRLGGMTGIHGDEGSNIGRRVGGGILEKIIPFKKGGRVKKTGIIRAHKGEFILPKGVKPTKKQIMRVKKKGGKL